jgi:hypothetical protein
MRFLAVFVAMVAMLSVCFAKDDVQKGDEAGEFSIAGEDGKLWGLRSTTVKLEDHVGHKVTVAGTASGESKTEAKKEKKD